MLSFSSGFCCFNEILALKQLINVDVCGSGEMADTPDLGSGAVRCGGSSPPFRSVSTCIATPAPGCARMLAPYRGIEVLPP